MKKNYETACGIASFLMFVYLVSYILLHLQTWMGFLNGAFTSLAHQLP